MNLSTFKKFGLIIVFSFFLVLFFPVMTFAQSFTPIPQTVNNQNIPVLTQQVTISVLAAMSCQITGLNPAEKNQACLGVDPKTHEIGYVQNGGGMIGVMGKMIAMTYTPPLHTNQFVAYMKNNFGIVKTANAQTLPSGKIPCNPNDSGAGYCGLTPLLQIWKVFRDLAFFVFTFIFTLIGLGVMLRIKIDPRTVMTLENQVPKVVMGLILISFSFAIAGFLIDLMYVGIYVIFSFFAQPNLYPEKFSHDAITKIQYTQNNFQSNNPFGVFSGLVGINEIVFSAASGAGDITYNIFTPKEEVNAPWMSINGFFSHLLDFLKSLIGYVLGWIAEISVFLVFAIAVLVALFRVWFALLRAYISILIDVIIAPVWIMAGVMPGSTLTFDSWIRDLLANLAAFPTVIAMFLLGRFFMFAFSEEANQIFIAPMIGSPVKNNSEFQPFASLIAIGIVLITPAALSMAQEFFKSPSFKWSATAFQQIGAGAGVPGKLAGGILNYGYGTHYDQGGAHGSRWSSMGGLGAALKAMNVVH